MEFTPTIPLVEAECCPTVTIEAVAFLDYVIFSVCVVPGTRTEEEVLLVFIFYLYLFIYLFW